MSSCFFKSVLVSSFGKNPAQRRVRAGVSVDLFVRNNKKISLLEPPFSAMSVLTAKADFAARFTVLTSSALRTLIRVLFAPRKSSLDFRVFGVLTDSKRVVFFLQRWAK